MILIDYSSIMHRCIHAGVKVATQEMIKTDGNDLGMYDENGGYITKLFITITKAFIMQELINVNSTYGRKYGEIVLCFDNKDAPYWRKEIYPMYKGQRKSAREESLVNYKEVFAELDQFEIMFSQYSPLPCVNVIRAEADDIILVIAKIFGPKEKILILSPDKDFLQSQRISDNIDQFSPLTKKWLKPENKNEGMEEWILEHVCLGDVADNVPRVIDFTLFSENFIAFLEKGGLEVLEPYEFYEMYTKEKAELLFEKYDVYKTNRKGEPTLEKDIFVKKAFGAKTLHKQIASFGGLDGFLDSHPLYRPQYELNYKLVMEEGIPADLVQNITDAYVSAPREYDADYVEKFMKDHKINNFVMDLPQLFGKGVKKEIDASFFENW